MPTHSAGSTLDAVLSRTSNILLISDVDVVEETGTTLDHFLTEFKISVTYPAKPCSLKTVSFREYSSFDLDSFISDINDSDLGDCQKFVDLDNALSLYENILTLDRHAPIRTKMVKEKFEKPKWWNSDCQQARRKKRQAERRYKKTKSSAARLAFRNASKSTAVTIVRVRNNYFKTKMEDAGGNVKQVYGLVNYLLGNEVDSKYPVVNSDENLAEKFAGFFDDKIHRIYDQFLNNQSIDLVDFANVGKQTVKLESFEHVPIEEIQSTVMSMHSKSCSLDVIPTWLLKKVLNSLLPILHFIVNSSLRESYVPPIPEAIYNHSCFEKVEPKCKYV